jgi:CRISPR-associated protein (TIGR02584 family)
MSPAVITETLWALAHEPDPILPRRIIAVTTVEGRRRIQEDLFSLRPRFEGRSAWDTFRLNLAEQGFQLDGRLRFGTTPDDLRVITAPDPRTGQSQELADIRTPSENEATADFLLDQVRQVVENPDTQLIASVAGGRKTMGALLYACLTLAGRETDRLTHVLVNPPFEQVPEFFFPTQPGGDLPIRGGASVHPSEALIELADVPFVPLRNLFKRELGKPAGSFLRLVDSCREHVRQAAGEDIRLTLDATRPVIDVHGVSVQLAPREYLILRFLADRAKSGDPILGSQKEALDPLKAFQKSLLLSAPEDDYSDWRHLDSIGEPMEEAELRRALSSLRSKLRKAGGQASHLADCLPSGPGRFSLTIPGPMIHLRG